MINVYSIFSFYTAKCQMKFVFHDQIKSPADNEDLHKVLKAKVIRLSHNSLIHVFIIANNHKQTRNVNVPKVIP